MLNKIPPRFRRATALSIPGILLIFIAWALWHFVTWHITLEAYLGIAGLVAAILVVLASFLVESFILPSDPYSLTDFAAIFERAIKVLKSVDGDPQSRFMMVAACPTFGLELEDERWTQLLQRRISTNCPTQIICLDPNPTASAGGSPLDAFCTALAEHLARQKGLSDGAAEAAIAKDAVKLKGRALKDLQDQGRLAELRDQVVIKLGKEPPFQMVIGISRAQSQALLYFSSTGMLERGVNISGISLDDRQIVNSFRDIFDYLWRYDKLTPYKDFDPRDEQQVRRDRVLIDAFEHKTTVYQTAVGGMEVFVHPKVFPPDIGMGIPLLIEGIKNVRREHLGDVPNKDLVGIDIGTGTGVLALCLAEFCACVYASDIDPVATSNALQNLANFANKHPDLKRELHAITGDLFESIPPLRAGAVPIIVFNQPYYPSPLNIYNTLIPDGGSTIIDRFLTQATMRLGPRGVIVMPYSTVAAAHNPSLIAPKLGLQSTLVLSSETRPGGSDHVYVFAIERSATAKPVAAAAVP